MLVITIVNPALTFSGLLGNLLSAMVVLAPVPTFYRICKKKSTESFHSVPYVVGLFSATMWVYYGILTADVLLLTINIAVCFIEVIYLFIFLLYAPAKSRTFTTKLIVMINLGVFGCLLLVSNLFIKESRRAQITGGICASFAVSVFVAPLSIIRLVIRTKSVEYMPFSLSFFLTLSAIAWFSYGMLLGDLFVAVPNVFGFLLGITQIIIYLIYMNHNKDGSKAKMGSQELPEKKSSAQGEAGECAQVAEEV
ncbi:bidirectional sugar transporter SWEET12-like [Zingiber officinale]|uniref:bidirectional sugar transporter SWEET12-like n=1 Tax=Zingiber officinale TaxID=94328 RepID=UPI001C4D85E6|nr:bidirectional sugar transporter SWEET12-like [Zingiber officinale]